MSDISREKMEAHALKEITRWNLLIKKITPIIFMDKKLSPQNLMDKKLPPKFVVIPPTHLTILFYTTAVLFLKR